MRKSTLLLFLGLVEFASMQLFAQTAEPPEPMFKFNIYGYISYEAYVDTYESVITRDGELYLYPKKPNIHPISGEDLNENFQANMLALQSRVGAKIAGPEIMGAKTSGVVETDFLGTAEEYKNLLRLRHAYFSMKWKKTTMLMGMYWHPLFTPECFPGVIGFGAAVPYNPLNRSPQVRLDYQATENIKLVAVAAQHVQGYHHSVGPDFSQRNAGIPDVQVQAHIKAGPALVGIGGGYHELQPLVGARSYKTTEKVKAFNAIVFGKAQFGDFSIKAKGVVGQNLTHQVMLGGYGRIFDDMANDSTFRFTSIMTYTGWVDVEYKLNENLAFGLFGGMSGNMGAKDKIVKTNNTYFYERNADIAKMYRIAPRVMYSVKKMQFAMEYFLDEAAYATQFDEYYKPKKDGLIFGTNHRILFTAKYNFN